MAKPLKTVPTFTASFWKRIGDEVSDRIQVHTKKGKDVRDANFKEYSPQYEDAKSSPERRFKRQTSFSRKPDLTLTGDMLRNLQTRSANKEGVIIGWSGTDAQKVQWNADMGREITTTSKPVTTKTENWIDKQVGIRIDRNIKATNETKTFVIG